jgi:REP element-mobilizing transposase RayT
MPRAARIVIAGVAHHITQRGNNRQDVFFVEDDRRVYLDLLHAQCQRYGFSVTGYCLMTNHVHIIGIPQTEDALAKAIGRTHFFYTQYINKMYNRSGHLWQNRFYSCPMDDAHALQAMCYVELNPLLASMAKTGTGNEAKTGTAPSERSETGLSPLSPPESDNPEKTGTAPSERSETGLSPLSLALLSPHTQNERCLYPLSPCDYPWSSAAAHCGSEVYHPVLDMEHWRTVMPGTVWREILNQFTDDSETAETLRRHTHTGRPLGSDRFISKMERVVGCRLRPLPIGRPLGSKKPKQEGKKG